MSALFTPLRIGTFEVANRLMQAAHSKQYSDRVESDRETAYFVRRAEGGCALFVAGNHLVDPSGSIRHFQDAFDPRSVEANRRLTDAVHQAGARILVQLNHHGAQTQPDGPVGPRPAYAPSRVVSPATGHATTAMTPADIARLVESWARCAELARRGGFDGVELHLAHGYLLHQFLSPLYNLRSDAYGGDLDGRTRFPREVLAAVRARVGDDFTVGIRVVADERHPRGLGPADCREVIARLRAEARVDFVDLAAGGYHNVHFVFAPSGVPAPWLREEVAAVKAANPDLPVFGVGAVASVEEAAEVVDSGVADMVALTRAQLADPDLATKLREGRHAEIAHCIRLNQGCLGRGSRGLPVSCTVNPVAGRERERPPRPPTSSPRRWVVVGGGPAGMRATVELARDGHEVVLLERAAELGGQLLRARRVPGRESVDLLLRDLLRDLAAAGVEVRLGISSTVEAIRDLGADEVVVATGARAPSGTSLAAGGTWADGVPHDVVDAFAALDDPTALGRRVVVVDSDGTSYASGVVQSLLGPDREVEVVTVFESLFPHVGSGYDRQLLLERLGSASFGRSVHHVVESWAGGELTVCDALTGARGTIRGVDTVVAVEPRESVLPEGLASAHVIGDALAPRTIDAAIFDAVELAYAAQVPQ
ncbi:NAD(P)-binding protein [Nocardioides halotolerans]|uniref:oxidoreductase n=1 Tax=Nocardioides halotolerans TaxID=433660 RepID=UPI00040EBDFD|nr:NAD(P)-binding protein [Nocardioides halotolerans]